MTSENPSSFGRRRTTHAVSRRHRVLQHLAHGIAVHSEHPARLPGCSCRLPCSSSDAQIKLHQVHPITPSMGSWYSPMEVADGPVFKRRQPTFEPSTRYTLRPPFT